MCECAMELGTASVGAATQLCEEIKKKTLPNHHAMPHKPNVHSPIAIGMGRSRVGGGETRVGVGKCRSNTSGTEKWKNGRRRHKIDAVEVRSQEAK